MTARTDKQLALDRTTAARAAARAQALDWAHGDLHQVDTRSLGLVLENGEQGRCLASAWVRHRDGAAWSPPDWATVVATDQRLIARLSSGSLISLWWGSVVGFEADLEAEHLVLDYGDLMPRLLSGPDVAVLAVVAVGVLYGRDALVTHPALAPLRNVVPASA